MRALKFTRPGKKSERGQSFVELGLSLVFLLILLAAVIDLGWAFFTIIALRDAAQEGATIGSVCPNDQAIIRQRVKAAASDPIDLKKLTDPDIIITTTGSGKSGDDITVEIKYMHEIATPFVGSFLGSQEYALNVNVTDKILTDDCRID